MDDWENNKLGDIIELVYGKSLPKGKRKIGAVPVYGSNGIVGYHNEAIVNEPGIIVGRKGSAGNVTFSTGPFCPIDTTFYITQEHTKLDLSYLFYALEALNLKRILGDVGVPGLNREMAYLEELEYPETRIEQRKIAYVLGTVQKAIEKQNRLIKITTELKKALMQKLFTEGLHGEPQKETEIGLVPESWEVLKIGDYLDKTKLKDPTKEPGHEFIYVDVSSVSNEFFRIDNVSKLLGKEAPSRARKLIQIGDVIFATVRPTLKRIAKIEEKFNNQVCSTGYCVLKPKYNELDQEFLYQYLQTDNLINRIEKLQRGASYPAVRDTDVKNMLIPFPKVTDQQRIGLALNVFDNKIELFDKKKQTLNSLFKTLLHELMTGQRRVHELKFEGMVREYLHKEQPLSIAAESE